MAWECAECNAKESAASQIDAVCHHCGKPLCRDDQLRIVDNAFSAAAIAVHCAACKARYHARAPRQHRARP
jgi:hypothetical protein